MDLSDDDNSQMEREQLSEDTERLKRALLDAVANAANQVSGDSDSASDAADDGGPRSPVPGTSAQYENEDPNISFDLSQPLSSLDGSGELPVNYEACLMLNRAYQEILTDTLYQIQTALDYNREKQTSCRITMEETAQNKQTKKGSFKPHYIQLAMPYFKDKSGMTAPLNTDTLAKQQLRERASFITSSRQLKPSHVKSLTLAVKSQVLQKLMQPHMNRKELLVDKLDKLDPNSDAGKELSSKISDVDDSIKEISSLSDIEIYETSTAMKEEIDWLAIASTRFDGRLSHLQLKHAWLNVHNPAIKHAKWTKSEDAQLLVMIEENNEKNWEMVAQKLGTGRSAIQCLQRYMTELNPALKSGKWTREESNLLLEVIDNCRFEDHISWLDVADNMSGRTPDQCQKQYESITDVRDGRLHKWTPQEDVLLASAVEKFGTIGGMWERIAKIIAGRTAEGCRERWVNHVKDSINFDKFTYAEDRLLWKYCQECEQTQQKPKWSQLARMMGNRTDRMIFNRYTRLTMWKAHWDYFRSLPETVQEFVADAPTKPKMPKVRRTKGPPLKTASEFKWDMTEEEVFLHEEDMNEDFFVPRPMILIDCPPHMLVHIMVKRVQVYHNLVEAVHSELMKGGIELKPGEIHDSIDLALAGKDAPNFSIKKSMYRQVKSLHDNYSLRNVRSVAAEIKKFIVGQTKKKFTKKQKIKELTLDEKIEYVIANKFYNAKLINGKKNRQDDNNTGACANEETKSYDNVVLGLFLKALNVDLAKAAGSACRLQDEKLKRRERKCQRHRQVEARATASLLKLFQVENVHAALARFPALDKRLKDYSAGVTDISLRSDQHGENDGALESGSQDGRTTDSSFQNGCPGADKASTPGGVRVGTAREDPLAPQVLALPSESGSYKMPPLPPTVSTVNAFYRLIGEQKNLIEKAGDKFFHEIFQQSDGEQNRKDGKLHKPQPHHRLQSFIQLNDFQIFKSRFAAMFAWPALLSSMEIPEETEEEKKSRKNQEQNKRKGGDETENNEETIHTKSPAKRRKVDERTKQAVENSYIPEHHQERIIQGDKIFGAKKYGNRAKVRYHCLQGMKKRKLNRMRRGVKIEKLKRVYKAKEMHKEKQSIEGGKSGEKAEETVNMETEEQREQETENAEMENVEGASVMNRSGVEKDISPGNDPGARKSSRIIKKTQKYEDTDDEDVTCSRKRARKSGKKEAQVTAPVRQRVSRTRRADVVDKFVKNVQERNSKPSGSSEAKSGT